MTRAHDRVEPGPGQESVWDYPRPPRVEPDKRRVVVELGGAPIVDTTMALRVLETSHPPVFYIPRDELRAVRVIEAARESYCEWKGRARYFDLELDDVVAREAGWYYPNPSRDFEILRDHIALYASKMERCTVDGELAVAQPGDFYGGWITPEVVGPFKGIPGSMGW